MEKAGEILKKVIDEKGIDYLDRSTYAVYRKLIAGKSNPADARLVLLTLLAGIHHAVYEADKPRLADAIRKECYLQKGKADELAAMYTALFNARNAEEWKEKEEKGRKRKKKALMSSARKSGHSHGTALPSGI